MTFSVTHPIQSRKGQEVPRNFTFSAASLSAWVANFAKDVHRRPNLVRKTLHPMTSPSNETDKTASFIDTIVALKTVGNDEGTDVATIVDALDERAFGLLILIFAIPCLVPGLPGAQLIAIPIFLLALQMALGKQEVWLPASALKAKVKRSWIDSIAGFVDKRLRWTERLSKPRLTGLASGWSERVIGVILALAAVTIMLPITNTIPSLAITVAAVGLLQRDGLFTLAGCALALAWTSLLTIMVWGLFTGAGFAVSFIAEHLPWLAELLGR